MNVSRIDVVRAWKDPEYREGLSEAERAALPANPAGLMDLADAELAGAAGGAVLAGGAGGLLQIASILSWTRGAVAPVTLPFSAHACGVRQAFRPGEMHSRSVDRRVLGVG